MGDKRLLDIEISVQISRTACAAKALQINHVSLYRFLLSRPPSNDCWIVEDGFCGNKRHFPRRLGVKKGGFRPDSRVFASVEKALHGAGASSSVRPRRAAEPPRRHYYTICRAPVAQLDRASDHGADGWGFESSRATNQPLKIKKSTVF